MTVQEAVEMLSKRIYGSYEPDFIRWMINHKTVHGKMSDEAMSQFADADLDADALKTQMDMLTHELRLALAIVSNIPTMCQPQEFPTCDHCRNLTTATDRKCIHCGKEVAPF